MNDEWLCFLAADGDDVGVVLRLQAVPLMAALLAPRFEVGGGVGVGGDDSQETAVFQAVDRFDDGKQVVGAAHAAEVEGFIRNDCGYSHLAFPFVT